MNDSPREPWSAFYQTAIPTFVIAAASYALWSPFYLEGMAPYLAPVGVVTLAALYLVLAWTPTVGEKVRRALRPAFLRVSVVGVLVIAAVWAYWVRPIPEPTAEEISRWLASRAAAIAAGTVDVTVPSAEWPDWGRNTLSNLGRYLSPWIIALSVLGVGRALWLTFELRLRSGLLALFVVWGGFTVAYLYDPAVDPLHFWAIRRFTPLVLPGFVLAAALGWRYGVRRLPSRLRPLAGAGIVLALTLHGVSVTGPLAGFARDQGVTAQLAAVAEELPADDVVLVPTFRAGWAQWQTPLHFVFQRRLHPFDTASPRRMQRVIDWIDRRRSAGKPVHLLVERATLPADCCPYKELVGQFPLDRQVMEPTYWPVARTVRHSQRWLELYRLPPRSPAVASEP